jgi:nucleotide-binding universal stress UspA family protein
MREIICGTDFTLPARAAAQVAAAIASRTNAPLALVHVDGEANDRLLLLLNDEADAIGNVARRIVLKGNAVERLVETASSADLIVIGSTGVRHGTQWFLGTTAEQVAQQTRVPALVVRNSERLLDLIGGNQQMRAVVATDLAEDSVALLEWIKRWRRDITTQVHLAYVASTVREYERLKIGDPVNRRVPHPRMVADIKPRLDQAVKKIGGEGVEAAFTMTLDRTAEELVRVAEEMKADLIVVGTRQPGRITRFWHESVARGVLHDARVSVVVVPITSEEK